MVILTEPTFPGCLVRCRAIAMFRMRDEAGPDDKVLCIPTADVRRDYMDDIDDVPQMVMLEIEHFFTVYKDLEPGKSVEGASWTGRTDAEAEIRASFERAKGTSYAVSYTHLDVYKRQVLPLALGDHRWQLVEIAHQHQLDAAEGLPGVGSEAFQRRHEAVEQVGPHHRDLVDDQGVQRLERAGEAARVVVARGHLFRRGGGVEREEPMDRVAVDVAVSYTHLDVYKRQQIDAERLPLPAL